MSRAGIMNSSTMDLFESSKARRHALDPTAKAWPRMFALPKHSPLRNWSGAATRKRDKGRLPDFVPLIKSTVKTPAWRAMSHGARSLYVALKVRYNTRLQNSVYLSARMGAEELGSSKDYVA